MTRRAPPPTWTTTRSRRGGPPGAPTAAASSQPSVSPPSMARPLRLPWQVNGTAPAVDRPQEGVVGRVAGDARLALADRAGAHRARAGAPRPPGLRRCGMKTSRWRPAARATTAAARAAFPQEAMASGARAGRPDASDCPAESASPAGSAFAAASVFPVASGDPAASARASSTASSRSVPKRWRALCEPETLPVSSFTQTPPAAGEARGRRESGPLRANGVSRKPWPSTSATAASSRSTSAT